MRELILDIESTGLYVSDGHRIIEIALVEQVDGKLTGNNLHLYTNPERLSDAKALAVHGLTQDFLSDKPVFKDVAQAISDFIGEDRVVITCWDMDGYVLDKEFLNKELEEAGFPAIKDEKWLNVRKWSEQLYGHKAASLDKILDRFKIDRTERVENGHGALLDAVLLAKVYPKLKMAYEYSQSGSPKISKDFKNRPPNCS